MSPVRCGRTKFRSTKHAATRQAKPMPATVKWARPCQLTSPIPGGVPGGNPSDGSALKMPAATRPAPYTPSRPDAHADRRPGPSARRTPTAAAIVIAPVTRKVAIWIQPRSPFASWLAACRVGSNPSRVAICTATAST